MKKVRKTIRTVITGTVMIALWPAKKYIEVMTRNYEKLLGDNIRYFNPCI